MEENKVTPEGNATPSSAGAEHSVDGLLDNIQKLRKEKENFKTKVTELENQLKIELDDKLAQKEEWKTLAEQRLLRSNELEAKIKENEKKDLDLLKQSAIRGELSKLGMGSQYVDIAMKSIDLASITVDSDTKVVLGAESAAKALREKAAPLFTTTAPGVSHAAPQGEMIPLTVESYFQLSTEDKAKRENELYELMGIKRTV